MFLLRQHAKHLEKRTPSIARMFVFISLHLKGEKMNIRYTSISFQFTCRCAYKVHSLRVFQSLPLRTIEQEIPRNPKIGKLQQGGPGGGGAMGEASD